nr:hypothetical protein BCU15_19960 [Vibrio cyclitrophicus]
MWLILDAEHICTRIKQQKLDWIFILAKANTRHFQHQNTLKKIKKFSNTDISAMTNCRIQLGICDTILFRIITTRSMNEHQQHFYIANTGCEIYL